MNTDLVAYAIYPDRASFEGALDALRAAGFETAISLPSCPSGIAPRKTSHMKSTPRLRVLRLAPEPGRPWVASRMARGHRGTGHSRNRASRRGRADRRGAGRRRGRERNRWSRRRSDWCRYPGGRG